MVLYLTCTCSFVLDGWPLTKSHVDLLTKHRIIPVVIVEMQVSDKEMLRRAELDRKSPTRCMYMYMYLYIIYNTCTCTDMYTYIMVYLASWVLHVHVHVHV